MGFELMAEFSISSIHKLATTGLTGLPIAQPSFHDTLNSIDPHISFTIEHENNCQISFLDTLVSRDNGKLIINVYWKPTHTDRYLDFHSHHGKNHKISTAATLIHRATNLPNTDTGRNKEMKRVYTALESNEYPVNLIGGPTSKERREFHYQFPHLKPLSECFSNGLTHRIHVDS